MLLFLVMFPMAGALISYIIGRKSKRIRDSFVQIVCVVVFMAFIFILINYKDYNNTSFAWNNFCGLGLHFTFDGFRIIQGALTSFLWLATILFSKEYLKENRNRNRYYLFTLLTLGATMGVFLSSDLFTLFIFFEMMSFTSFVWVAHDEKKESIRAAETYLAISVLGGLVMLMGIFLLYQRIGTLEISRLLSECANYGDEPILYVIAFCLLFGFGAKAGVFLLHVWMPNAYTYAPAPASALLSGILSKTGIYGIMIISGSIFYRNASWGGVLLTFGVLTMVWGALMALASTNLKRILACSSMSQMGFILIGLGMVGLLGQENTIAARGTILHMVNHSLFKLILFMVAGVIFMNTGKLNLNEIRGYGRNKHILKAIFLSAAFGISGVPLFNGYVSKTLIHESIKEGMKLGVLDGNTLQSVEYLFIISGGLTVAYMSKLFIAVFIEKNSDNHVQCEYDSMKRKYMTKKTAVILSLVAGILPVLGCMTTVVTDKIADMGQGIMNVQVRSEKVEYFNAQNLKGGMVTILIGITIYVGIVRIWMMKNQKSQIKDYVESWPKWINLENYIYRPIFLKILPFIFGVISRALDCLLDEIIVFLRKTVYQDLKFVAEIEEGTKLTLILGSLMNKVVGILNKTLRKKYPIEEDYIHRLAVMHDIFIENNHVIARSLSFGLLLACIGFVTTLLYLLWW